MKKAARDDIWAMMNKPLTKKPRLSQGGGVRGIKRKDPAMDAFLGVAVKSGGGGVKKTPGCRKRAPVVDKSLSSWLEGGTSGGGSGAVPDRVMRLDTVIAGSKEAEAEERAAKVVKKVGTGLEGVLGMVKGDKGQGVLDKTREAWKEFKDRDEAVNEELDAYKKDKNRYTDKVAFLERTDRREWEADMARKKTR